MTNFEHKKTNVRPVISSPSPSSLHQQQQHPYKPHEQTIQAAMYNLAGYPAPDPLAQYLWQHILYAHNLQQQQHQQQQELLRRQQQQQPQDTPIELTSRSIGPMESLALLARQAHLGSAQAAPPGGGSGLGAPPQRPRHELGPLRHPPTLGQQRHTPMRHMLHPQHQQLQLQMQLQHHNNHQGNNQGNLSGPLARQAVSLSMGGQRARPCDSGKAPAQPKQPATTHPQATTTTSAATGSSSSPMKPAHSYIGLIGMCILSSPEKRMVLNDIYQHILNEYPYYRGRSNGWRNSVRHNLSLNECFKKAGRAANGKGHYWTIHPANMDDFMAGDFRRRRAQRKVRRWNNMEVNSDESDDEDEPLGDGACRPPLPDHFYRSIEMHRRLEMSVKRALGTLASSMAAASGGSAPPASAGPSLSGAASPATPLQPMQALQPMQQLHCQPPKPGDLSPPSKASKSGDDHLDSDLNEDHLDEDDDHDDELCGQDCK